jgi:hypothetical protein
MLNESKKCLDPFFAEVKGKTNDTVSEQTLSKHDVKTMWHEIMNKQILDKLKRVDCFTNHEQTRRVCKDMIREDKNRVALEKHASVIKIQELNILQALGCILLLLLDLWTVLTKLIGFIIVNICLIIGICVGIVFIHDNYHTSTDSKMTIYLYVNAARYIIEIIKAMIKTACNM